MTEVSIVMPCLNEEASLAFCIGEALEAFAGLGIDGEVIIADNGSKDNSVFIARACGARVVNVARRGYGAAVMGGVEAARGRYIIMGDADGSYDFSAIGPFVEALRSGCGLVVGNRFRGGIQPGAMPLSHRIGAPVLSALARWRFKAPVGDFHCGLRAFEREAALSLGLSCPGMEFATEMIARFAGSGAAIAELPAVLRRDRRGGKSHLRTVRDGLRHLYFILFDKPFD